MHPSGPELRNLAGHVGEVLPVDVDVAHFGKVHRLGVASVDDRNLMSVGHERLHRSSSDESRPTQHQNAHRPRSVN